jgi:DNA replication protein DnaC
MTNKDKCLMSPVCRFAGQEIHCNDYCFPFRKAHGESGEGGIVGLANIPKQYRNCTVQNLPIEKDNPEAYEAIKTICSNVEMFIDEGVGLYLYSSPNENNPRGTGTGKTTSAITIMNAYLTHRIIQHVKQERLIEGTIPAMFVKMSKLQNEFKKMYTGSPQMKEEASIEFYHLKKNLIEADLLVIDDIGLRISSPSFTDELYEIIDDRVAEGRATIYTSNVPLNQIGELVSEQVMSRIYGSTEQLAFKGDDKRRAK